MINRIKYWVKSFENWMEHISDAAAAAVLTTFIASLLLILGLTIYGACVGITACSILLIIFAIVFTIGIIWALIYDAIQY